MKIIKGWNRARFYFSFLLLAFYSTISFLFLFTTTWIDFIPKGRGLIGLFLFIFASVRFYIAYRRYKKKELGIQSVNKEKQLKNEKQAVTA